MLNFSRKGFKTSFHKVLGAKHQIDMIKYVIQHCVLQKCLYYKRYFCVVFHQKHV